MNEEELIELFKKTFPFWDKMSEKDKETFVTIGKRIGSKID